MRSNYTKVEKTWAERVETLRQNLADEDYGRLYFLLALCIVDAYDDDDYERHESARKTMEALRNHDYEGMENGLEEMGAL